MERPPLDPLNVMQHLHVRLLAAAALAASALAQSTNIAPLGVASQNSNYVTYSQAWRAIDGFTSGVWTFNTSNRLSSTGGAPGGWWQLDLPRPFEVTEVRIYNRADCCPTRLSNFRVSFEDAMGEVYGEDFFVGTGFVPGGGILTVTPPAGTLVTRVRIALINGLNNDGNGFLTLAEVEVDSPSIGNVYCSPATPNVAGRVATITAVGTNVLASPLMTGIVTHGLPEHTFGYFLVGSSAGTTTPPGAHGPLCLGGAIGRYSLQIHNTSHTENMGILIDRSALPVNPARAILPGETWRFQAWFRDGSGSNFSDAVAVTFS